MKKLLLLLLVLSTSACAYDRQITHEMWDHICLYAPYDECKSIAPPDVVYTSHMAEHLYGYYDGGTKIYVNRKLKGTKIFLTILHESIHYLQQETGRFPIPTTDAYMVCMSEQEAFEVGDSYVLEEGLSKVYLRGALWWKEYSYCHEFFE